MEQLPCLLLTFANLVVSASSLYAIFWIGGVHFYSMSFLCVLLLATVFSFWSITLSASEITPWKLLSVLTVGMLVLSFSRLGTLPIWLDEDMLVGRLLRNVDTFFSAARAQQPPSGYFLDRMAISLLGPTLFGIRFFSALFMTLSVPLFYLILAKNCHKKFYAFLGTVAFMTDFWVQDYAHEARPYALGIFFFLVFLHAIRNFLDSADGKFPHFLFSSGISLLLSLGLQPVLLMLSAGASGFFLLRKENRRCLAFFSLPLGAALLLFLPIQWAIVTLHENHLIGLTNLNFSFPGFFPRILEVGITLKLLFRERIGILFLVFFGFFLLEKNDRFLRFAYYLCGFFLLSALLVFVIAIPGALRPRYLIFLLPLSYLLGFASMGRIELFLSSRIRANIFRNCVTAVCLGLSIWSLTYVPKFPFDEGWPRFYAYLRESRSHGAAFVLNLNSADKWSLAGFLGLDVYDLGDLRANVLMLSEWDIEYKLNQEEVIIEQVAALPASSDIFIYSPKPQQEVSWRKYKFPPEIAPEFLTIGGAAEALRLKRGKSPRASLLAFLKSAELQETNLQVKEKLRRLISRI